MVANWLLVFLFTVPNNMVEEHEILALSPEMKTMLDQHIRGEYNHEKRLHLLIELIFDEAFLGLHYANDHTKTSIETFETRNGNCLSFTNMFVAMARYLGLDAGFQEVVNFPSWDRQDNVVVLNLHMNALVRLQGRRYVVDFNPFEDRKDRTSRAVPDHRAKAQYYNNRGAEFFRNGDTEQALVYFKKALSIDPDLSFAWSNLGVAYSKSQLWEESEKAYLLALKSNRQEYTAMTNLAKLYQRLGREKEAHRYLKKVSAFRNLNPYYHFSLGEQAYHDSRFEDAVKHFRRAIKRKGKEHEFYFALAKTYSRLDDLPKVIEALKKARQFAPEVFDRNRYSQKLEKLAAPNNF